MKCFLLLAAVALLTNFTGCDPANLVETTVKQPDPSLLRLSYGEGICFGECEVFTLDVYSNGLLVRKGERYTDQPGTWQKSISRREVTSFLDSISQINFKAYPRTFPSRLPDMPATTLTWYDGAQNPVTLTWKEETSPELRSVAQKLKEWSALDGYRQRSATLDDGRTATANGEREEIIVHLRPLVDPVAWLTKYGKQDLQLKNRVSPNGNYYVVTANPNKMAAAELLDYLRKDAEVISAQLNQDVQIRQ
ncbi:DUF6438 domain-containing protein [Lewinella sp. 4G2]|uniref:DUF6438 domain-containing protein n=1 Tax=Lewinella sp. 4G2 TaxID=1803372 RepID=UPI0007B4A4D0|nr:DUF6438 domain-containing protein [Lewinella sp. 4G2]OAV44737.1 hypothetical protein A3850_009650 [Lewinella sp. 4G2]